MCNTNNQGWIYYDPDFRPLKNIEKDDNKIRCIRCQKEIKDTSKAVQVETTYDLTQEQENKIGWAHCRISETGKHFIGLDCWKTINQEVNNQ